jgi:hypothetical protein
MAEIRRAAGTRTMSDLLRGRLFGTSADDLEALDRGQTLAISAFDLSAMRASGRLLLTTRPETRVEWQPYVPLKGFAEGTALPTPYAWGGLGPRRPGLKGSFQEITFSAGGTALFFGIPQKDLPTLETALVESTGGSTDLSVAQHEPDPSEADPT